MSGRPYDTDTHSICFSMLVYLLALLPCGPPEEPGSEPKFYIWMSVNHLHRPRNICLIIEDQLVLKVCEFF